ncbi:hypothetical protein AACH06_29175 [Ideonella sp. DXS29W]|uniref:Uncharacterized protein n=1 Tax=Ideonella lacteola TaxID=2984193 RepID=A0ABU9C1H4_9BURK
MNLDSLNQTYHCDRPAVLLDFACLSIERSRGVAIAQCHATRKVLSDLKMAIAERLSDDAANGSEYAHVMPNVRRKGLAAGQSP